VHLEDTVLTTLCYHLLQTIKIAVTVSNSVDFFKERFYFLSEVIHFYFSSTELKKKL